MLSSRISDYPTITQGKTRIPGVNDAEELESLDVSLANPWFLNCSTHAHLSYFLVQKEQAVIYLTIQLKPYYIDIPGLKCRCKNCVLKRVPIRLSKCMNFGDVTLPHWHPLHRVVVSTSAMCQRLCFMFVRRIMCWFFYVCFCVNFKPMQNLTKELKRTSRTTYHEIMESRHYVYKTREF